MDDHELEEIYGLKRFVVKPGLDAITGLLEKLDQPHKKFKSVHIAGTNGKGSVAAMLESIFRHSGYRTGLYTSPHLHEFNERIRVDGKPIRDEDLRNLIQEVKMQQAVTFFEFTTALAFTHFAKEAVDIAIIEAGMGGRLDATNVLEPMVSIITMIGHDHEAWLGYTKEDIAREKAGIIKKRTPVVLGDDDKAVINIVDRKAHERNAPLHLVDAEPKINDVRLDGQVFTLGERTYHLPLLGVHQLHNACTVITACDILGWDLDVQRGLERTRWPGRMDIISKDPLVIVDGAHNKEGIEALRSFINPYKKGVLVVGLKKNRNHELIKDLVRDFREVIFTSGCFKPQDPHTLQKCYLKGIALPSVDEAVTTALSHAQKGEAVVITGSLYLIGPAITAVERAVHTVPQETHHS